MGLAGRYYQKIKELGISPVHGTTLYQHIFCCQTDNIMGAAITKATALREAET